MDFSKCSVPVTTSNGTVINATTLNCVPIILQNVIFWLILLSAIVSLFFVIFGGFKFLMSGGDPKQVDGARKTLTYSLVGLAIVLLAGTFLSLIGSITGTACIKNFSFSSCQPKN